MTGSTSNDLLDATGQMCLDAGLGGPLGLEPLAGGKNNRVFRVPLDHGDALVLKSYFHDPRDPRDRLRAEWDFLSYAWARGVRAIPRPVARRPDLHLGLYGFVPGRKLAAAEVSSRHLAAAADFVVAINAAPRRLDAFAPGSEACFTLAQHITTVERRLARLAMLDPGDDDRPAVDRFVTERLDPSWRRVRTALERDAVRAGIGLDDPLRDGEDIVSPSDFGFHNALIDDASQGLSFIDFEYAGRDDPAKLACDFFCQPEIAVPVSRFPAFVDRLAAGLGLADGYRERCRMLLDLYHVKWAIIILNQFMPVGATRRAFAAHAAGAGPRQIARAEAQLVGIAA